MVIMNICYTDTDNGRDTVSICVEKNFNSIYENKFTLDKNATMRLERETKAMPFLGSIICTLMEEYDINLRHIKWTGLYERDNSIYEMLGSKAFEYAEYIYDQIEETGLDKSHFLIPLKTAENR